MKRFLAGMVTGAALIWWLLGIETDDDGGAEEPIPDPTPLPLPTTTISFRNGHGPFMDAVARSVQWPVRPSTTAPTLVVVR